MSARKLVARLIVVLLIGITMGYAMGKSVAKDAAKGRELTLKEYIGEFESHREELIGSDMSIGLAIFVGALMMVLVFGVYELLVAGVDKLLRLADRPRALATDTGTPPPWDLPRP
jgi:hypothetical protein